MSAERVQDEQPIFEAQELFFFSRSRRVPRHIFFNLHVDPRKLVSLFVISHSSRQPLRSRNPCMGVAVRANKRHQARHHATGNDSSCRERIAPSAGKARPRACPAKTRINHGQSSNCPTKNAIAPPKAPGFHKRAFSLAAISSCFHSPKRHDSLNVCLCLSRQRYIPPLPVAFPPFPPFLPTEGCRLELLLRNRRPRISILLPVPFTTPHHITSHHTARTDLDKMSSEIMAAYWQAPPMAR